MKQQGKPPKEGSSGPGGKTPKLWKERASVKISRVSDWDSKKVYITENDGIKQYVQL